MGHQIETHGSQAAAVFARTDAWHRLGTTVRDRAFTAEEAMTLGHLGGWDVRTAPLAATVVNEAGGHILQVPDKVATVRTNPFTGEPDVLGVVGGRYTPLQNEDHAELLNLLAHESGAVFETAGSLRGGRQVFLTMQLPHSIQVAGTDRVDPYIAALNSHDGTSAFRVLVTPMRVVCANTQAAAIRDHVSSVCFKHTANAKAAVQQARTTLGLTVKYCEAFAAEAEQLVNTTTTDAQFWALIHNLYPPTPADAPTRSRNADADRTQALATLWHDAPTQNGIRGTAWAAYQAVTEYVDHYAPVRVNDGHETARATRLLTTEEPDRIKRAAWAALTPA
jgi:phage/plasmid-like protein (TIGR03299 family)